MNDHEDLAICTNCGTQFDTSVEHPPKACRLCNDPRHFVPERGQTWTSFRRMRSEYHNKIVADDDMGVWTITTEPRFAIGERAFFIPTAQGNVLWDVMAYLDDETIEFIRGKGGLDAIVISHPHFYTSHLYWARVFDCPVYVAAEDETWLVGKDVQGRRRLISGQKEEIIPGVVTAFKTGGHFPGSLVLLWEKHLFIADTLFTVPSSHYPVDRHPGTTSYAFMWSIPNMIPLPPSELVKIWKVLKELDFKSTHGGFAGMDVRDRNVKLRVLESMKIQVRAVGYKDHEVLGLTWP